jgi:hypothetical protein
MRIPIPEYPGIPLSERTMGVGAQNMVDTAPDGIVRRIKPFQSVIIILQKRKGNIITGYPELPIQTRHFGTGGKRAIADA